MKNWPFLQTDLICLDMKQGYQERDHLAHVTFSLLVKRKMHHRFHSGLTEMEVHILGGQDAEVL